MKRTVCLCFLVLFLCGCHYDTPQELQTVPTQSDTVPVFTTEAPLPSVDVTFPASESDEPDAGFDPYRIINEMSLEALVGQILLARCPDQSAIEDIYQYHLGGYLLFGKDFATASPETIRHRIADFQNTSGIPMLIAVDEEGGTVTRVSSYEQFRSSPFPSPRVMFDQGGLDLILDTEAEKCRLLKSLGINVNLAPVCDITTDPNAFMYRRSLGQSPSVTGAFAAEVCAVMAQEQIGSVLKHFPGYGNNDDTHTGIAVDNRSLEALEANDLIPFRAGIAADCGGILVSHTVVTCIDPELPASLSPLVIEYLRNELDFYGVIITDDLCMEAVSEVYGPGEAAVLAVLAGNDMLCSSDYAVQYEAILDATKSGRISLVQLQQAVARILQWKYKLGLLVL